MSPEARAHRHTDALTDVQVNAALATWLGFEWRDAERAWARGERHTDDYTSYWPDVPCASDRNTMALAEARAVELGLGGAYRQAMWDVFEADNDPRNADTPERLDLFLLTAPAGVRARALLSVIGLKCVHPREAAAP